MYFIVPVLKISLFNPILIRKCRVEYSTCLSNPGTFFTYFNIESNMKNADCVYSVLITQANGYLYPVDPSFNKSTSVGSVLIHNLATLKLSVLLTLFRK